MKIYFSIIGILLLAATCKAPDQKDQAQAPPVVISDSTRRASSVYLTLDEKDKPVISWCEMDTKTEKKNFFMAYFDSATGYFLPPVSIPLEQNALFHEEGMPKVAIKGNGTIMAVYETAAPSETNRFAGFVRYTVSADKGKNWTKPQYLHTDTTVGTSHSFAAIARLGDGEIGAAWLDQKMDGTQHGRPVKFSKTNPQNAFGNEILVDAVACECCRIAIAGNPDGKIAIAFRDIINDSIRDMSIAVSADNGKTFGSAVPFSNDGWIIHGCPHNGPSIASSNKSVSAAWFAGGDEKGVYYAELGPKMEPVSRQLVSGEGRFIQLCLLPDGSTLLAYDEKRKKGDSSYNKIVLNRIVKGKIYADDIDASAALASYPVVQAYGSKMAIVAWRQEEKIYYSMIHVENIRKPVEKTTVNKKAAAYTQLDVSLFTKKDLVCGMPVSPTVEDTASYQGYRYGFCSRQCKSKFVAAPATYARRN